MKNQIKIIIIFSVIVLFNGCNEKKVNPKTGKELFEYYCSACHGESAAGQFLRGIPPLVKNKALRPVPLTPSQIKHKIKKNLDPKSKMPSFANLSDTEARLIANYINTLSK